MDVESLLRQRGYDPPAGDNFLINCPFHEDENPSLSVHRELGVFKCFSCSEKGNMVKLISQIDGVSTEEAEDIIYLGFSPKDSIQELSSLLETKDPESKLVNERYFFSHFSEVSGIFLKYLKKRKISEDSIDRFGIRCSRSGKYRNRVVIPIRDYSGRMISFNARAVFDGTKPKTRKLKKSRIVNSTLFGYHEMPSSDRVVLVEGELDAIFLQQFGIPAVALMGKILSEGRIDVVTNKFKYVYLSYDGDRWGRQSAEEHLSILKDQMPASVIKLPNGKDPNDLSHSEILKTYREVIPGKAKSEI